MKNNWKKRMSAGIAMLMTVNMLEPMSIVCAEGISDENSAIESEEENETVEELEEEFEEEEIDEEVAGEASVEEEAPENSDVQEEITDTISGNQISPEENTEEALEDEEIQEAEKKTVETVKEVAAAWSIEPDFYCYQDEDGIIYTAADRKLLAEISGYSFPQYSAYGETELLPAPTGVHWSTKKHGHLIWNGVSGSEGDYILEIYKDDVLYYDTSWSGLEESGEVTADECIEIKDSGIYKFRVKAGNWSTSGEWSEWSEEWDYVKPTSQINTPTGLKWDKTTGKWDAVKDADGYYAELERNGEMISGYWSHGTGRFPQENFIREMTEAGNYTFKVQALSGDITKTYHSSWSASSPKYGTGTVEEQAESALDEALEIVDENPDAALQAVTDGIDVNNMAVAMQTDADVLAKVEELEQAYANAKNVSVTTQTDSHVNDYVDASGIKVVGAALNAASGDKQMVMDFSKIDDEINEEAYPYRMKNWVQFSIDLEGRVEGDKLLVPVRITLPIPKNVVPERFRILHYHQDGTYEEIDPVINGDGTASFTVTSFSPFVFGNELKPAAALSINKTDMALQKVGDSGNLTVTLKPVDANSNLIWTSDDESVATVEDGKITAMGKGTTIIRVAAEENSALCAECKVAVAGETDAESGDIVYLSDLGLWMKNIDDQVYTGKNICPEIEIYDNGTLLTVKKDYTVSYKNNKNAGTASVMITGKGNYSGKGNGKKSADIKFSIVPKNINELTVSFQQYYAVSNKKQAPLPKITNGSITLKNKTDYTLTYTDEAGNPLQGNAIPKGANGNYRVVITGQKNYTGEIVKEIQVVGATQMLNKATVKLASGANKKPYKNGEEVTLSAQELTVTLNKQKLVYGKDYLLEYEDNVNAGKAKAFIVPAENSNYVGSKEIAFTITGTALSKVKIEGFAAKLSYTGEEVTQSGMVLKDKTNSKVLQKDTDYTVTTTNNVRVGKATVVIQGIGGYTGTVKKTFTITPYTMNDSAVKLEVVDNSANKVIRKTVDDKEIWYISDTLEYSKGGCKPTLTVTCNGETVNGKYTYKNADQITQDGNGDKNLALKKMPCLTFTGNGNFNGKITVYYGIHQADISGQNLQVNDVVYNKKAGKFVSAPVLTDVVTGKKLAAGTDYEKTMEYTYEEGDEAGNRIDKKAVLDAHTKIRVTVMGKGKYTGTISEVYEIIPASVSSAAVKVKDQIYTGAECLPDKNDVTVKIGKITLTPGTDYEIMADGTDITNVGTRSFKIVGKGDNYGGTKTVKFKIKQKSFLWWFFK